MPPVALRPRLHPHPTERPLYPPCAHCRPCLGCRPVVLQRGRVGKNSVGRPAQCLRSVFSSSSSSFPIPCTARQMAETGISEADRCGRSRSIAVQPQTGSKRTWPPGLPLTSSLPLFQAKHLFSSSAKCSTCHVLHRFAAAEAPFQKRQAAGAKRILEASLAVLAGSRRPSTSHT